MRASVCLSGRRGVKEDRRRMDRLLGVCSSRLLPLFRLPLPGLLSSAVLTARGDWSGPGNGSSSCGERGCNGQGEREGEGGSSAGVFTLSPTWTHQQSKTRQSNRS